MDSLVIKSNEDGMDDIVIDLSPSKSESQQRKIKINYPTKIDVDWENYITDESKKEFVYDLVQKIVYSVQDLNNNFIVTKELTVKDIIYVLSLVCWISNAMYLLRTNIKPELLRSFIFNNENELTKAYEYLRALRSFAVAHPLDTTSHKRFSLDGKKTSDNTIIPQKLCVDIRLPYAVTPIIEQFKLHTTVFSFDGIIPNTNNRIGDYYLYYYRAEDNYKMGEFIACFMDDLYNTAQLYINKLCALEQYLNGLDEVTDE